MALKLGDGENEKAAWRRRRWRVLWKVGKCRGLVMDGGGGDRDDGGEAKWWWVGY